MPVLAGALVWLLVGLASVAGAGPVDDLVGRRVVSVAVDVEGLTT